jgi:broad-specificity NMP kinase
LSRRPAAASLVSGDPGIGKTAIAAELVKSGGHVHHFNILKKGAS